jgi:protein-disulfide isomerase
MSSKTARAERREQRREAERAAAAAQSKRRRVRALMGAAGLALILVAVGIVISATGGKDKPAAASNTTAASVVAGIPENDGVLGDPNAPITLTEYLDPQCPICADAAHETLPTIIKDYVRTGKAKLQARTLSFIGPDSVRAAKVAAGAAQQGKLWAFLETFYASQGQENTGYVTDEFLTEVLQAAGADAKQALAFADGDSSQEALDQADAQAQQMGVDSTPSFSVTRGHGDEEVVAVGTDDLTSKLEAAVS